MATPLLVLPLQLREAQPCVVAKSNTDVSPEVLFTKALSKALSINALEDSSRLTQGADRQKACFQFLEEKS